MKLYIIIPDVHDKYPEGVYGRLSRKVYHPAYRCVENVVKAYKPDGIVYIGDTSDLESLSFFDSNKRGKLENKRYWKDVQSINHLLDRMDTITSKDTQKEYIIGNHEERVNTYTHYQPEMAPSEEGGEGGIDWVRDTHLIQRGYNVTPFNHTLKIGKAIFMHGFDTSQYHARNISQIYPKTIFYGHTHDVQTHSFKSPIDQKDIRIAESLGCLCDLNPNWLKNKPNKWIHAFGMFWVKDNGEFQMDRKIIVNGECVINGKVFKATA